MLRPGPLLWKHVRRQGNRSGEFLGIMADFIRFPCPREARPWNSSTEYSNAMIAEPTSFSRPASSYFSTINSSRTTPSTASSARPNVCAEGRGCAPRPVRPVRSVERKPLCPSSRRKGGPCCAGRVSRSRLGNRRRQVVNRLGLPLNLFQS